MAMLIQGGRRGTGTALIRASPARAWEVLRDVDRHSGWQSGLTHTIVLERDHGRAVAWRYIPKGGGAIDVRVLVENAPVRLEVSTQRPWVDDTGRHVSVRLWRYDLGEEAGNTRVRILVTGDFSLGGLLAFLFRSRGPALVAAEELKRAVESPRAGSAPRP